MEEYILHSALGKVWANHKYIDKFFKNGKWNYIYPSDKSSSKPNLQSNYQKTNEYYTVKDGRFKKTTEYTKNGSQWLSSKKSVTSGGGNTTVFKTKGKIEQGVEKTARKGANFISNIGKKAKNAKKKVDNALKDYNDKHTYINGKSMYEIRQEEAKKKKKK